MQKIIDDCVKEGAEYWWEVAKWAKENNHLTPFQRSLSGGIAKSIQSKGSISYKQAAQGAIIKQDITRLGFKF